MTTKPSAAPRLASLDQFRGYTVAGMLLVNFVGRFPVTPPILKHHNTYCSYADTIMPQFFFAVGFAYRLTLLRRIARDGPRAAFSHAWGRNLGLILFGLVLYHLDGKAETWDQLRAPGLRGFLTTAFQREPFQTLVHIGIASIWVMPVMAARSSAIALFAVASGLLHLGLSWRFYFDHAWNRPVIDGGPLGFLTWSLPLLAGALAYDAVAARGPRRALGPLVGGGLALMALGYALSCAGARDWVEPPFVPPSRPVDLWTMSQRTGSASYQAFAAGFSLVVYALFVAACDIGPLRIGLFRTFGTNALVAYVLHGMVAGFVAPYLPKDAPYWYAAAGFWAYFGLCYLFVRHLERQGVFVRM
jgi:predicted acyltransferase